MNESSDFYKWFNNISPKLGAKLVFSHYQTAWNKFNK